MLIDLTLQDGRRIAVNAQQIKAIFAAPTPKTAQEGLTQTYVDLGLDNSFGVREPYLHVRDLWQRALKGAPLKVDAGLPGPGCAPRSPYPIPENGA